MKSVPFLIVFICYQLTGYAQALRVSGSQFLEKSALPSGRTEKNLLQSVRVDAGKLWINGNLVPHQELPLSLNHQARQVEFYATFQGIRSVELLLNGKNYLIQPGRVSDISRISNSQQNPNRNTDQHYLEKLRQESPETFKALSLEAELNQKSLQLSREYITTPDPRRKAEIRTELRRILDELFDLNVRNQNEELEYLQAQIEIQKEELKIKQSEKARLVAKNLSELTDMK